MAGGSGAPGANSRGRGGKFRKFTRGGGKHFSRDLQPVDSDGNKISMWADNARRRGGDNSDEDEDDSEEDSEEDSDEDSDDAGPSAKQEELSREERKKQKKLQKDAAIAKKKAQAVQVGDMPTDSEEEEDSDDDMPANPNHSKAARKQALAPAKGSDDEELAEGVKKVAISRKERESLEAAAAKEKYRKLHEAGKTDEAKADLARLREIREKREAEAARRQAEKEEAEAQAKAKRAEIEAKEAKKREAALGPSKKKGKSAK